jgi:hypothetical protein
MPNAKNANKEAHSLQLNIHITKLEDGSYLIRWNHGIISKTHKGTSKTKEDLAKFVENIILKEA